jgi:hypothetical protein
VDHRNKHNILDNFQAESKPAGSDRETAIFTEPETKEKGVNHGKGSHFPTPRMHYLWKEHDPKGASVPSCRGQRHNFGRL